VLSNQGEIIYSGFPIDIPASMHSVVPIITIFRHMQLTIKKRRPRLQLCEATVDSPLVGSTCLSKDSLQTTSLAVDPFTCCGTAYNLTSLSRKCASEVSALASSLDTA
jgi:hypothetical protein